MTTSGRTYTMGRSEHETLRLINQARLYENITIRFFNAAGIGNGMKVLDIGSGAGDVAMAAAALVGRDGHVVGVDMNPDILNSAQARVESSGYSNIEFRAGNIDEIKLEDDFDAVVGRLVLMYLKQPETTLKHVASCVKPGGIVAFQEAELEIYRSMKHEDTPVANQLIDWCLAVFQGTGANVGMGFDTHQTFVNAGLPAPELHFEAPMGCSESWIGIDYIAAGFKSLLPAIVNLNIATAEQIDVDTLADRLRAEIAASKRPLILPPHVLAHTALPN